MIQGNGAALTVKPHNSAPAHHLGFTGGLSGVSGASPADVLEGDRGTDRIDGVPLVALALELGGGSCASVLAWDYFLSKFVSFRVGCRQEARYQRHADADRAESVEVGRRASHAVQQPQP